MNGGIASAPPARRAMLFGIEIDPVTNSQAIDQLMEWITETSSSCCKYVVTPNVDHVIRLKEDVRLQAAYRNASMVLADGWPVVTASRLIGQRLPERVAGSDMVPALFHASRKRGSLRVFLLGGMPGVAELAVERIGRDWPHVEVVGIDSPPLGFENDSAENERLLGEIERAEPELIVVGLGAPKQEIWLNAHYEQLAGRVAIAAGATIDFLAGVQTRAPKWIQKIRMEWLFRAASDPRRLAGRYARGAIKFPPMVLREMMRSRRSGRRGTDKPR